MREIDGNLITLAQQGHFDVITHGCNCFCTMGAGIAPQMAKAFGCNTFEMEHPKYQGDINKLGTINFQSGAVVDKVFKNWLYSDANSENDIKLTVINSYTQYNYGRNHLDGDKSPVDYDAITMCMQKINHIFRGKTIGLPKIGAGLAGGDWGRIKKIIETELNAMDVIIVYYDKK